MFKVLVTGGAGYIGSVLVKNLLDTAEPSIDALDVIDNFYYDNYNTLNNINPRHLTVKFSVNNIDVRDFDKCAPFYKSADIIIPLAAIVGAGPCEDNESLAVDVNETAIKKMMKVLSPNQLVLFPNSNSGYGTVDGECNEDTPLRPISIYGLTKQRAEEAVLEHPNSIVFRLATVFGVSPRMRWDLLVNNFVLRAVRERRLQLYEEDYWRNFVHIDNVADVFMECVDSPIPGGVYNLGNDRINMTKRGLAETIKLFIDDLEILSGAGNDPDQRNYKVSSKKLHDHIKIYDIPLEYGITELIRLANLYRDIPDLMFRQITSKDKNY